MNESGEVQAVVEDFGNEDATVRLLADFEVPSDRTIQVWTLPSPGAGVARPHRRRPFHPTPCPLPLPGDNQLYELILEQAGGSPTGRPTGPILAKGLAKLPR